MVGAVSTVPVWLAAYFLGDQDVSTSLGLAVFGGAVIAGFAEGVKESVVGESSAREREVLTDRAAEALSEAVTQSTEQNPAEFLAYWEYTHRRLNSFHQEASTQVRSAYRLAQLSAVMGFVLVLSLGVAAAWPTATPTQTLVAGGLAAVAAALSAYIGHTFQDTYRQALAQSMTFFSQPVLASRLLTAERLVGKIQGQAARDQAWLLIVAAAAGGETGLPAQEPRADQT